MKIQSTWTSSLLALMLAVSLCHAAGKPSLNLTFATAFVVFPQDANANPPMAFGGKLLSEMDRCAGITTRRFLYASPTARDAVTVTIKDLAFRKGAKVKDLLFVTGTVIAVSDKTVSVRVTVESETAEGRELLVDGVFVFCAYDLEKKKGVAHGLKLE